MALGYTRCCVPSDESDSEIMPAQAAEAKQCAHESQLTDNATEFMPARYDETGRSIRLAPRQHRQRPTIGNRDLTWRTVLAGRQRDSPTLNIDISPPQL